MKVSNTHTCMYTHTHNTQTSEKETSQYSEIKYSQTFVNITKSNNSELEILKRTELCQNYKEIKWWLIWKKEIEKRGK